MRILFILLVLGNYGAVMCQCNGRYLEKIFHKVDVTYNIEYGRNINSRGVSEPLSFDIYEPSEDTATNRAVLIMMHGGAYWVGKKNHGECTLIGQDLGRMGYVVISPDYRRENTPLALLFEELMIKAVGRGTQDTKAIIRYLYKSAQEGNPYRIDTNKIFIGGASAGAFNALHTAYLDNNDSINSNWKQWIEEIGGLEGDSGNYGYSTNVAGIISISGALGDIQWMTNNTTPLTIIHNTQDPQIPYYYGQPYGIVLLPFLYGGSFIHQKADSLSIYNTFYSIPTEDHTAYEENGHRKQPYYDSTVYYMTHFMADIMGCENVVTAIHENSIHENIFINNFSTNGNFKLSPSFFGKTISIYDEAMKLVWQRKDTKDQVISIPKITGLYLAVVIQDNIRYIQSLIIQ